MKDLDLGRDPAADAYNDGLVAGRLQERERIRQRIMALPAGWSVARKTGGDSVDRKAVLKALGGSDE